MILCARSIPLLEMNGPRDARGIRLHTFCTAWSKKLNAKPPRCRQKGGIVRGAALRFTTMSVGTRMKQCHMCMVRFYQTLVDIPKPNRLRPSLDACERPRRPRTTAIISITRGACTFSGSGQGSQTGVVEARRRQSHPVVALTCARI